MHHDRLILGCYAAIALCLTASLAGCGTPDANANGRLAVNEVFNECAEAEAAAEFEGRTLASLEDELGESEMESRFRMNDNMNEFRVALLNQFPVPTHADRQIVEQTWSGGQCTLTVWSSEIDGDVVSVDSLLYSNDVVF